MPKDKNQPHKLDQAKHKAVDYQVDISDDTGQQKPRNMKQWRSLIEERIQEAMDEGRFDNLPGRGKPLARRENPLADSSEELANGILQNNGYTPEWVERGAVIRVELANAREELATAWEYYQPTPESELGWRRAVQRFEASLNALNQKIRDYNLVVPILSKQRLLLHLDEELVRMKDNQPSDI